MSLWTSAAIATAFVVIAAGSARAQEQTMAPLAEVARQAEAAKPTVKKATKTYTNANLSRDSRGEPAPAPAKAAAPVSKSLDKSVPAAETVAGSVAKVETDALAKQSEASWRSQAASLRKQIDDMQSRIATLTVPNDLTDSNPGLKKANDISIANARAALEGLKKRWARFEASARELKVPSEWLDPRPKM